MNWRVVALTLAAMAIDVLAVRFADEPDSRPVTWVAYLIGASMALPLLAYRRWPLGALLATAVLLLGYYTSGFPGMSPAIPLAIVLYLAASAGYRWWSIGVLSFFSFTGLLVAGLKPAVDLQAVLAEFSQVASLMVAVVLLAEALRTRRAWLTEVRERLRRVEADRDLETERRVTEERLRIARELHDVMAHTISVITVQAGVAVDRLADYPPELRGPLEAIRSASTESMTELAAVVGVLRGKGDHESAPRAPAPGLDQIDELVAATRETGLRVELHIVGTLRTLPQAVDLTGYRIVQEALTNVVRHAHASTATVRIGYTDDAVRLEITDDGTGAVVRPNGGQTGGHGLIGMAERAAAVGGELATGAGPAGGFRVQARLPAGTLPG
ncbi:MAG TPA: sensor histidine kinase [Actinophytocola sp.]|jgi:signal transduction histidine kinase|uniref:sensor histidine kinase n=1 Tax=Actinophytocola sp. TaxID=1872138 RepID=UPI002E055A88|nr:sensor histidine kinase [Actinophytocola sp.]